MGQTGLIVSSLGLGTLTWGRDTDYDQAKSQLEIFSQAGGTLIDTAVTYADSQAESVLGKLFATDFRREDFVICSKAGINTQLHDSPVVDASRRNLLNGLETSLRRLGTDHLDIWFVQHFDPYVRAEETLSALLNAVESGKTRYVGVSNYPAWALAELATLLKSAGLELTVAQNEYSLIRREVESEVLPAVEHFRAGFFAYSPLGRGVLTGKYRASIPPDSRAASSHLKNFVAPYLAEKYQGIIEGTVVAAEGLEQEPLQLALSWVRDAPGVTSVLTGARTAQQLRTILKTSDQAIPYQIRRALNQADE